MKTIQHFVGGKSFTGESKRNGKVFNPATGEQIAQVKLATKKDVNEAVQQYGKIYTLQSIIACAEFNELKIKLGAKKWFG